MKYRTTFEIKEGFLNEFKNRNYEVCEYIEYIKKGMTFEIPIQNNNVPTVVGIVDDIINIPLRCFDTNNEYILIQKVIIVPTLDYINSLKK